MLNRIREPHCEFWRTYSSINSKPGMEEKTGKTGLGIDLCILYLTDQTSECAGIEIFYSSVNLKAANRSINVLQ